MDNSNRHYYFTVYYGGFLFPSFEDKALVSDYVYEGGRIVYWKVHMEQATIWNLAHELGSLVGISPNTAMFFEDVPKHGPRMIRVLETADNTNALAYLGEFMAGIKIYVIIGAFVQSLPVPTGRE